MKNMPRIGNGHYYYLKNTIDYSFSKNGIVLHVVTSYLNLTTMTNAYRIQ